MIEKWKRWYHRLPWSREGVLWLLIAGAMMVTGIFKGINLITLLACWVLVLAGLNWWLARRQILYLTGERQPANLIIAGTPFSWRVRVRNGGRRTATSFTVHDDAIDKTWFVGQVAPGQSLAVEAEATLARRGLIHCPLVRVTCGYPVGLARVSRAITEAEQVVVAPPLGRLQRGILRQWISQHCPGLGLVRAAPHRHASAHTEFHGLRSFRSGDSPRHIHWRTTARRGELMVREFEDWPNDNLILLVDGWTPTHTPPGTNASFERMLSLAATIVWEWCRLKGDDFVLGIAGRTMDAAPAPMLLHGVTGQGFALEALRQLGSVEGGADADFGGLLERLQPGMLPGAPIIILTLQTAALAAHVHDRLHRPAGQLNVAAGEEADFFDEAGVTQ